MCKFPLTGGSGSKQIFSLLQEKAVNIKARV